MKGELGTRLLIQSPASLGFGGGHVQALMYQKYLRAQGLDAKFLDFGDPGDRFDILHVLGMQAGNAITALSAKQKGKKVVLSSIFYTEANLPSYRTVTRIMSSRFAGFSQNRFYLMQRLLDAADVILPNSQAEADQLEYIFRVDKSKVRVLYNGVEPDLFRAVDKKLFPAKHGVAPGYVLCVANVNRRKNTLGLMRAFLASGLETKLVLIGEFNWDSDRAFCEEVAALVKANGDRIVHVTGLRYGDPLLLSAYVNAKVHALPSVLETPGLANLEAGLAGANLVIGDCAPVHEYFGDKAWYADPVSVPDIAAKIREAYHAPSTGLAETIKKDFSWAVIGKKLSEIYRSL